MRKACAIVLDEDKTFIAFADLKRENPLFFREIEIPLSYNNSDIVRYLQDNSAIIDQKIREVEKDCSGRISKTFMELPQSLSREKTVEEVVILKRRKTITPRDIAAAKKYLENKFLDWDDFCIHNLAVNYEVEGTTYYEPPLGVRANKIKLRSHLLWIKDRVYKETEDIFSNFDRVFGGFIAAGISMFSAAFVEKERIQVVINIGYSQSRFEIVDRGCFVFGGESDFSLKGIIRELGKQFLLGNSLSEEIFERYVSFKEVPYFQEITVKKEEGVVNLSIQALNSFIKSYVSNGIARLIERIKATVAHDDFKISFIGRLNAKEGFWGFLRECVPSSEKVLVQNSSVSLSRGCLRYGVSRFLERDYLKHRSLPQRLLRIYREYF